MKKFLTILVVLAVLATIWTVSAINGLVYKDEAVTAKWSQVLNQYQRRNDLIPNLVNTVKGYAAHEEETLQNLVNARTKAAEVTLAAEDMANTEAIQKFQEAQSSLNAALSRLMIVVENYPDLKASENFLTLQSQLEGTENRIAVARRDYIEAVRAFNTQLRTLPTAWIAAHFTDFKAKETFNISSEKSVNPEVKF